MLLPSKSEHDQKQDGHSGQKDDARWYRRQQTDAKCFVSSHKGCDGATDVRNGHPTKDDAEDLGWPAVFIPPRLFSRYIMEDNCHIVRFDI